MRLTASVLVSAERSVTDNKLTVNRQIAHDVTGQAPVNDLEVDTLPHWKPVGYSWRSTDEMRSHHIFSLLCIDK